MSRLRLLSARLIARQRYVTFYMVQSTGASVFCFLSSLPLLSQPPRQCLAPICHLSTLNLHCIAGAGLPIHMTREVSWDQKEDECGPLSILLLYGATFSIILKVPDDLIDFNVLNLGLFLKVPSSKFLHTLPCKPCESEL